jgi:hypothetical protein
MTEVKGPGRAVFAAVLLMIGGVLNLIYGIAAIGNSKFFVHDTKYVFGNLKTWGWVTLILGIIELLAALSIFRGGNFGRYFGMAAGGLAAIGALLSIPAYPFWSIAVFGLSLWIIHGLTSADAFHGGWGETPAGSGPLEHGVVQRPQ